MKKIVGIFAAAAMVASVFAVDFTAGMQIKGSLFNYDGASKDVSAMKLWSANGPDDKPFIFSASDDRAGATIKIYDAKGTKYDVEGYEKALAEAKTAEDKAKIKTSDYVSTFSYMEANKWNIWFKPLDMLKIDLGTVDTKLNCETITYWKGKVLGGAGWAYKATVELDGINFGVALGTSDSDSAAWFTKPDAGDSALGETDIFFNYSADFGTISALFVGKDTFKDISVGAGYKNTFGDLSIFADAAFFHANDVNGLKVDADVKYAKDALTAEAYAQLAAGSLDAFADTMAIVTYAKVAYALDFGTVYAKFLDDNLKADPAALEFEAGLDGSVGAMSYNLAANVKLENEKVNFGIPFWTRFSF